jgi:hypothetical protein
MNNSLEHALLGNWLKGKREAAGLSQAQVAGLTPSVGMDPVIIVRGNVWQQFLGGGYGSFSISYGRVSGCIEAMGLCDWTHIRILPWFFPLYVLWYDEETPFFCSYGMGSFMTGETLAMLH